MNTETPGSGAPGSRMTLEELTALCELMVSLTKAGVALDAGLLQLATELPGRLSDGAQNVSEQLAQGQPLTAALAESGAGFPPVYVSVVEAGLRSGRAPAALEGVARLTRQIVELRKLVVAALVYPLCMLLVLVTISVSLLRVLPGALRSFVDDHYLRESTPPAYAAWLDLYHVAADWFFVLPLALIVLALAWILVTRSATAAEPARFSEYVRWVPGAGNLLRNSRLLVFVDTLRLLVKQGVPLSESLRLAGGASGDLGLARDAEGLAVQLERGEVDTARSPSPRRGIPRLLRFGLFQARGAEDLERVLARAGKRYQSRTADALHRVRVGLPVFFSLTFGAFVAVVYTGLFLVPWFAILRLIAGA